MNNLVPLNVKFIGENILYKVNFDNFKKVENNENVTLGNYFPGTPVIVFYKYKNTNKLYAQKLEAINSSEQIIYLGNNLNIVDINDFGSKYKLTASYSGNKQFPKTGGSGTINITSNTTWMVSAPNWITLSQSSVEENGTISFQISNNSSSYRTGNISIYS